MRIDKYTIGKLVQVVYKVRTPLSSLHPSDPYGIECRYFFQPMLLFSILARVSELGLDKYTLLVVDGQNINDSIFHMAAK